MLQEPAAAAGADNGVHGGADHTPGPPSATARLSMGPSDELRVGDDGVSQRDYDRPDSANSGKLPTGADSPATEGPTDVASANCRKLPQERRTWKSWRKTRPRFHQDRLLGTDSTESKPSPRPVAASTERSEPPPPPFPISFSIDCGSGGRCVGVVRGVTSPGCCTRECRGGEPQFGGARIPRCAARVGWPLDSAAMLWRGPVAPCRFFF
eukprot:SAG31_NODE_974_length_10627_cov_11.246201_11_plen_210_part_00